MVLNSQVCTRSIRSRQCCFVCLSAAVLVLLFIVTPGHWTRIFPNSTLVVVEGTPRSCLIQVCTVNQSRAHGNLFATLKPEWSGCYADIYLLALSNHSTTVQTLIDVGANKAYAVSTWLSFFSPELNVNPARLGKYLESTGKVTYPCGSCNDCADEPLSRLKQEKLALRIYAFEPQPGTVEVLRGVQKWMNISNSSETKVEIHGMAVSDRTGPGLFKKCNAGNEVCNLDISGATKNDQVQVQIMSLDDFADKYRLDKIDVLKIDTEGYEPLVFRGAQRLISEHRIRLFIFEHLKESAWLNTSLAVETDRFTKMGYVCYMIGKTGFIRVTNCWDEQFNTRHNNLLCVSSRDQQLLLNIDQMRLPGTIPVACQTT